MSDTMDPRGQAGFSQDEYASSPVIDDLYDDDGDYEDEDDEDGLDTQGDDPLLADLGADGQGDLAPEDEEDEDDWDADDGPNDLRTSDEQ